MKTMLNKALALVLTAVLMLGCVAQIALADPPSARISSGEVVITPKGNGNNGNNNGNNGNGGGQTLTEYTISIFPNAPAGYENGSHETAFRVTYVLDAESQMYYPDVKVGDLNLSDCLSNGGNGLFKCVGFSNAADSNVVAFEIYINGGHSYTQGGNASTGFDEATMIAMSGLSFYAVWSPASGTPTESQAPTETTPPTDPDLPSGGGAPTAPNTKAITFYANVASDPSIEDKAVTFEEGEEPYQIPAVWFTYDNTALIFRGYSAQQTGGTIDLTAESWYDSFDDVNALADSYYCVWEEVPQSKTITFYANFPGDGTQWPANNSSFSVTYNRTDKKFELPKAGSKFKDIFNSKRMKCDGFSTSATAVVGRIDGGATYASFDDILQLADTYYAVWNYQPRITNEILIHFAPGWVEGCFDGYKHPYTDASGNTNTDKYPRILAQEDDKGSYVIMPDPDTYGYTIRADYVFDGWALDRAGTKSFAKKGDKVYVTRSIGYYACYIKKVHLHANNGTTDEVVVDTKYVGSDDVDLSAKANGYKLTFPACSFTSRNSTFAGWTLNADGSGTLYQPNDTAILRGERDYYAKWIPNGNVDFTVNYYVEGETAPRDMAARTASSGTVIDAAAAALLAAEKSYTGFRYTGYDPENTSLQNGSVINLRYAKTHTVTYQYTGSVPEGEQQKLPASVADLLPGETVTLDTTSHKVSNFEWSGWSVTETATGTPVEVKNGKFAMPNGDATISGHWTWAELTVNPINQFYANKDYKLTVEGRKNGDVVRMRIAGEDWQDATELTFHDAVTTTVEVEVKRAGVTVLDKTGANAVAVDVWKRSLIYDIENKVGADAFTYQGWNKPQAVSATLRDSSDNGYGLVRGEEITVNLDAAASQTFVTGGIVTVNATGYAAGNASTNANNYSVTINPGSIEVLPRAVSLALPSPTFDYDATTHTVEMTDVSASGFYADDVQSWTASFAALTDGTPSNQRRVPGNQPLSVDETTLALTPAQGVTLPQGATLLAQYAVSQTPGTLTVSDASQALTVTLTVLDVNATYDGITHNVLATDTGAYTVEGLPDGVTLSGVGAAASGRNAGDYPIAFEGTALFEDTTTTPATNVTACIRVVMNEGELAIARRPIRFLVGSVNHVYDGSEYSANWSTYGVDNGGAIIGGLADSDMANAALNDNARTNVGTTNVSFNRNGTTITNGADDVTASYDVQEWGTGAITITPAETSYTVRYFYDDVLDTAAEETGYGMMGEEITSYTAKAREGMRLDYVSTVPLALSADPTQNVIDVHYATRDAYELMVDVETPLAGTMMSVTTGDTVE